MEDSQSESPDPGLWMFSLHFLIAQFLEYIWPLFFSYSLLSAPFQNQAKQKAETSYLPPLLFIIQGTLFLFFHSLQVTWLLGQLLPWPDGQVPALTQPSCKSYAHTDGPILKSAALSRKISVWTAHLGRFLLGSHCNLSCAPGLVKKLMPS